MYQENYKEIRGIVDELYEHAVEEETIVSKPTKVCEGEMADPYIIYRQVVVTLEDGMEIDLCHWVDYGCQVRCIDISIDKKHFAEIRKDKLGGKEPTEEDFIQYLPLVGLYTTNVKQIGENEPVWKFGIIKKDNVFRVQYSYSLDWYED